MPPQPLDNSEARIVARERLQFLAIGYYVRGGVVFVFSSFFLFYVVVLSAFSFVPESSWNQPPTGTPNSSTVVRATPAPQTSNPGPPPVIVFRIMAGVMCGLMSLGWMFAGITAYAGRCIQKRRRKTLIYVAAALNCIFIPYGTLLGVFTFIILGSPAAIEEFDQPI